MTAQKNDTNDRLPVAKTYKLYIGGRFPRSESGRSYTVSGAGGAHLANAARASRKDARDAVAAARRAFAGWSAATAYNRGQVLYRIAEMLEGRREQFVASLQAHGDSRAAANGETDAAIDTWIYYAGFSDKFAQVIGGANPVAAPYFNFSMPEPTGVVAVIAPSGPGSLHGLAATVAPAIVSGNTVVVVADQGRPLTAISFAEVLATSDVPAGVMNVLTGHQSELAPVLAAHMDVNAIDLQGVVSGHDEGFAQLRDLEAAAADNLKRVIRPRSGAPRGGGDLAAIERFVELKTVWHPIGV